MLRVLILGLLLLSGAGRAAMPDAVAYSHHARQWSVEQGLPQETVTAVVQDQQGFMWAGTQNGLARFDGTRFRVFTNDNSPLLPGGIINALALDEDGRLWIGTEKGLAVYVQGHFVKLPPVPQGMGGINSLARSGGGVWIAAEGGLFHIEKGNLQARAVSGWTIHEDAGSLAVGLKGGLWVGVKGGVYGRVTGDAAFHFYPLPDDTLSVSALAHFDGRLWVGTNSGLYESDGSQLVAVQTRLQKRSIRALLTDPLHHLWIGTDASVFRLDQKGGLVDFSATPGLEGKWVWSMAMDRGGDIWIGTFTDGMIRLWGNRLIWFSRSSGLTSPLVDTVFRDEDGSILVGSKTGVFQYRDGVFHLLYGPADLPNPLVNGFLRRTDDQLWIATAGGLAIMQSGKPISLPSALAPLAHADIYHLRQDRDGTIWIATIHGLFQYQQGKLRQFDEQDGLGKMLVRGTYRFDDGPLWVGTAHGLFELSQNRFHRLCEAEHLEGQVLDMAQGAHGVAWVVVADGSLFKYAAGQCTRYDFTHPPLAGSLYFAAADGRGNLWLTNDGGIYRVAISGLQENTSKSAQEAPDLVIQSVDGLQQIHSVGGTPQAGMLDPDRHLWVPVGNGMVVIDLDHLPSTTPPAPVIIESVTRGSSTVSLSDSSPSVTFPPGNNDLRINYAALDYHAPESVQFQYRLFGYDSNWVDAGTRPEALYTHLPPDHYRFEVRVVAPGSKSATQSAVLSLVLQPFFFQTWWFYLLLGLLAAGLVYAAYALRIRHVHARQALLEAIIATRTDELQEANNKLQQASLTDPLTGLKNRRYFVDVIEKAVAALRRESSSGRVGSDMVVLMLDLDDFKEVNDSHGHHAGDAVLQQLGQLLLREVRESDHVIRWGGEEFLIVAQQSDRDCGGPLAESLRSSIAKHAFTSSEVTISCTCSIGYCVFPFVPDNYDQPTWEGVVNLADAALYEAKHRGKNTWVGVKSTHLAMNAEASSLQSGLGVLLEKGMAELEVLEPATIA